MNVVYPVIYDAVDVAAIPSSARIVLAYIDGDYVTLPAVKKRFPNARILTVTTTGENRADLADVESGDLIPETGAIVYKQGLVRALYSDTSSQVALAKAVGGPFDWFAADPTGIPHLVKSSTSARVVGTQYAWPGHGSPGNYDVSLALPTWVTPISPPNPSPSPGGTTVPIATDTVAAWEVPGTNGSQGFELHADGGLFAFGGANPTLLTYEAIDNEGDRYHFGPNGDHATIAYPGLPAATHNVPFPTRHFVDMNVIAYAGKAA
jgi:hypothetical protein